MRNTLVTESDVTSSMMGEMYRQLASAQLRGKLYKTGYRRTKAAPKEVQMGVTGQSSAIAAPQLKTPPRLVRLVTVPRASISTKTVAVTSPSSPVPQMPMISMK